MQNGMIFIMPTSSEPLKPSWGLFTLNCFIRQSALTNFSIELVELILPIVTFVIIHQKLFYTYFCECEKVSPLWDELCFLINNVSGESFTFSNFEKMFGVTDLSEHDSCINFLFFKLEILSSQMQISANQSQFCWDCLSIKMLKAEGSWGSILRNGPLILKCPNIYLFI